ncbi:unnamed protein product [Polarella glacialis]|uniref:Uncharacterized protein n=1 Tax=Polarella glacialis TaxID=89957 RepID=A0A813I990_POLGL|nr:unnamed protein product [Polarella glacialis]
MYAELRGRSSVLDAEVSEGEAGFLPDMYNFQTDDATVEAEKQRLAPEFEERYRQHAFSIEEQARQMARYEASKLRQVSMSRTFAMTASVVTRQEYMALEGRLVQETVLAEELQASQAAQLIQLKSLEAAAEAATARSRSTKDLEGEALLLHLRDTEKEVVAEAREARIRAEALKLRIAQLEADLRETTREGIPPLKDRVAFLEEEEKELLEQVRRNRQTEQAAQQAAEQLRERVLDLSGDCGAMLLGASVEDNSLQATFDGLCQMLPTGHPALQEKSLDCMLAVLEAEREAVLACLIASEAGGDAQLKGDRQQADELARQLAELEEKALQTTRRLTAVEAETRVTGGMMENVDDRLTKAATLRKENQLMLRQQAEWKRSEARMLRLADDLQTQRARGATGGHENLPLDLADAKMLEVASRDREQLALVAQANHEMSQRIIQLEEEKAHLIHSQRGLESFIRSRVPDIEAKLAGAVLSHYPPSP